MLSWCSSVIATGGVVGLSTTLLIGLYAQARVYLGMARDGALPAWLAQIHSDFQSPFNAQLVCGAVAIGLATLFDVHMLSSLLSIGYITMTAVCSYLVCSIRTYSAVSLPPIIVQGDDKLHLSGL